MQTPWGALPVSDGHVHFFSHAFFASLASQSGRAIDSLSATLGFEVPGDDPRTLACRWIAELDRHSVERAALIASVAQDEESVMAAVDSAPDRFYAYAMVDPHADGAAAHVERALRSGRLHALCFFPAMHRYSIHDEPARALIHAAAAHNAAVFVHCGVLTVGVRRKLGLPSQFDMRYSNPIDLHAVALRYPEVRFVVPHFGAGYFREALMLCDLCPNVYLDTSSSNSWIRYESNLDLRGVFRRALDVAGSHRLIFGTDSSFFPRGWHSAVFDAQAKALYESGIDSADARLIFHDNLASIFSEKKSPGAQRNN